MNSFLYIFWSQLWGHIPFYVIIAYLVIVAIIALFVLLENRSPHKTISWILVLTLLPVAGIVFYLFFGQTYRKTKLFNRKGLKDLKAQKAIARQQFESLELFNFSANKKIWGKRNIMRLLLNNSYALITNDNEVDILNNARETFSQIVPALKSAKRYIHIEYYIISDDNIGSEILQLLMDKARNGVEVRLIYDDVGSWELRNSTIKALKRAGVIAHAFMKVRFPMLTSRVNFRNHRKTIIIDGKIGFLGGINIADRYIDGVPEIGPWRDTHLCIKGSAVSCLQMTFIADWYFVSNKLLPARKYVPPIKEGTGKVVQIASSSPDSDWASISQAYFSAIASAKKQVYIGTPYFMPTGDILTAIKSAGLSGIDIRLLIPEKSDARVSKWCTESYVEELLEAGVRVYLFKGGFYHSKLLLIDGVWSSVGSANMDFRSLETNFETNAVIYDKAINRQLVESFNNDLQQAVEVNITAWRQRTPLEKLKASFARLFSPLM